MSTRSSFVSSVVGLCKDTWVYMELSLLHWFRLHLLDTLFANNHRSSSCVLCGSYYSSSLCLQRQAGIRKHSMCPKPGLQRKKLIFAGSTALVARGIVRVLDLFMTFSMRMFCGSELVWGYWVCIKPSGIMPNKFNRFGASKLQTDRNSAHKFKCNICLLISFSSKAEQIAKGPKCKS